MLNYKKIERISKSFYLQKTEKVARELIGKLFVKKISDGEYLSAEILETEAYLPDGDLACHAAKGKTPRNSPMFENGGILYVYFIYGNHYCSNIVTEEAGKGAAVLIRAAKPIEGIEIMKNYREIENIQRLCNGPGNFAKAFGINKLDNYQSLFGINNSNYCLFHFNEYADDEIVQTNRIGIKQNSELPLRFYLKDSEYISRK